VGLAFDQRTSPAPRLASGRAAGQRPAGLRGWAGVLRRRLGARLRGRQDVDQLIAEGMTVGREVFVADGVYFDPGFAWLISIGDQSTVGPGVTILAHDATPKLRTGYSAVARVAIGARVFIGANAVILPGVKIGDDAIVGAGSVVRHDVAPNTVVTGNPAVEVGTTDEHTARHAAELARGPRYELGRPPDAKERERIRAALGAGRGYVD
jgi:maltose O-acetyltransferase